MGTEVFTADHAALRDSVRAWVDGVLDGPGAAFEWRRCLEEAGALGYLGAGYPEADGGGGGDLLAAVVVAEELGRARRRGAATGLLAQACGLAGVLAHAHDARRPELLPALLAGRTAASLVGWTPDPRVPPAFSHSAGRLTGTAHALAAYADVLGVLAQGEHGPEVLLVPADHPGLVIAPVHQPLGLDGAGLASVEADGPVDRATAVVGVTLAAVDRAGRRWLLLGAAMQIAGAWRTFEDGRRYALEREAFGRAIGHFQANRHALARMATTLSAARAAIVDAATAMAAGADDPGRVAATRLFANRTAAQVSDACLQLHGGYGYTTEFDVERAWRDDRTSGFDAGEDDALRAAIAAGWQTAAAGGEVA